MKYNMALTVLFVLSFALSFGFIVAYSSIDAQYYILLKEHNETLTRCNRSLRTEKACWTLVDSLKDDLEKCEGKQ